MTRISTIASSQMSLNMRLALARQSSEMSRLSQEAATGLRQDVYAGDASKAGRSLDLRGQLGITESFIDANRLLEGKLEVMTEALSSVQTLAGDFRNLTLSGDIAANHRGTFRAQAEHALGQITDFLNTTYQGGFLFSGHETGTAPLDPDGTGTGVIYRGGAQAAVARIDAQREMAYGLTAKDPAFNDIFAGLGMVLNVPDLDTLSDAEFGQLRDNVLGAMNDGIGGLTALQGRLGDQQQQLSRQIESQEVRQRIYTGGIGDIEAVNLEETAVRLQQIELQLQTTYQITARMSGLSLLNYL
ncbi:flagellin [Sulfitobacter aestuarii]|uniref:Flagellin n=1 Tax=Sulfitobacter aestuarii TaxID=2161676 RepID=A0ABW5U2E6_9RHOB